MECPAGKIPYYLRTIQMVILFSVIESTKPGTKRPQRNTEQENRYFNVANHAKLPNVLWSAVNWTESNIRGKPNASYKRTISISYYPGDLKMTALLPQAAQILFVDAQPTKRLLGIVKRSIQGLNSGYTWLQVMKVLLLCKHQTISNKWTL